MALNIDSRAQNKTHDGDADMQGGMFSKETTALGRMLCTCERMNSATLF